MRLAAAGLLIAVASCSPAAPELTDGADIKSEAHGAGTFVCTPERVWDGDGPVWCAEGPKVRLAGIAARELDGSCRPGHPCPDADPIASRDHLAGLLGSVTGEAPEGHLLIDGPSLSCSSNGSAGGDRVGAWCASPTVGDLSCRMVADGMAARWDRYWRGRSC